MQPAGSTAGTAGQINLEGGREIGGMLIQKIDKNYNNIEKLILRTVNNSNKYFYSIYWEKIRKILWVLQFHSA